MSNVDTLVKTIAGGKNTQAAEQFASIMREKLASAIEDKRVEVAQKIYSNG